MNTPHPRTSADVRARARVTLDAMRAECETSNESPGASAQDTLGNTTTDLDPGDHDHPGRDDRDRGEPARPSKAWPTPLGGAAYHGVIGELVQAIEPHTEADPAGILTQMLVMLGNVIGRTAHFRVEADTHHLNLFAAIVGATAKGRKGVSGAHARRVFQPVDSDWLDHCNKSGLSSGEGLIWAVRDPISAPEPVEEDGRVIDYETVVKDAGVADKRLLAFETELAATLQVLRRPQNILSAVIRAAWDGRDLQILTKNNAAEATAPHISIIGHITRDELRRQLDAIETANGFANRFLWVCVRRSKLLPDGGAEVDVAAQVDRIRAAVEFARQVGELRRDPAASRLWHQEYPRLSTGHPGLLGAMTARAEAQVMRIACLYAVQDMSSVVGLPHLRAALEVWRYCFESARHIFGSNLGDPTADRILRALQSTSAGLTRREFIHKVCNGNKSAAEIGSALDLLLEYRLARREEDRSGGGRPAERWFACEGNDHNDQSPVVPGGMVVKVVGSSEPVGDSEVIR